MKIGIDMGGSHIGIGLINSETGTIIEKQEQDIFIEQENNELKLVETIIDMITKILERKKVDIKQISLIGIAVPGMVSETHIIKAKNLHINNFNIVSEINKYFNIPIILRNDAKCAAIAEKEYGSLKKYEDALFLSIGTGIGGAVYIGNKLIKPKKYEGIEIGHIVIKENGVLCNCGRKGCFEKYASIKALKEKVEKEYELENYMAKEIKELLEKEKNTEKANKILDEYVKNLSIGLGNLINIFEPQVISIGGSFVYYKELILDKLNSQLKNNENLFNGGDIPKIVMAKLKNNAGIIGATIE